MPEEPLAPVLPEAPLLPLEPGVRLLPEEVPELPVLLPPRPELREPEEPVEPELMPDCEPLVPGEPTALLEEPEEPL